MTKRILVLGASGFIGRAVVSALAATSWAKPVAAVHRNKCVCDVPNIEFIHLDATDIAALQRAAAGVDGIVNCVAGSPDTIISAARALAALMGSSAPPARLVHLSSMAVYGRAPGTVSESAPLRGDLNAYGAAKVTAEQLFAHSPTTIILRPGIVYGPHSPWWSDSIGQLLIARRLGNLASRGEGVCNLLYIADAAGAICKVLAQPGLSGAYNLAMANPPSWNQYFASYARALGLDSIPHISAAELVAEVWLRGPLLKITRLLGRSRDSDQQAPILRPWLLDLCRHSLKLDVSRIERNIDMTWTSVTTALTLTASWFHGARAIKPSES